MVIILVLMKTKKAHHNKKVARNRGKKWRKNLAKGKLQAVMNPTPLRQARVKAMWSQEGLAEKLCCSLSTYGDIERGKRAVKLQRSLLICEYLGVKPSKVFVEHAKNKFIAAR